MFDLKQYGLPCKVVDRDGVEWLAVYRVQHYIDSKQTLYLAARYGAQSGAPVSAVLIHDETEAP